MSNLESLELAERLAAKDSGIPEWVYNEVKNWLATLGVTPSGTVRETDTVWSIFNDHAARDSRAQAEGTYDSGRFSISTTFGGKWYCCMKQGK